MPATDIFIEQLRQARDASHMTSMGIPHVCLSDIALSDAMDWGLKRTATLADGCKRCDFRFKKDGETQISSKTPEVQVTIDRIWRSHAREHPM